MIINRQGNMGEEKERKPSRIKSFEIKMKVESIRFSPLQPLISCIAKNVKLAEFDMHVQYFLIITPTRHDCNFTCITLSCLMTLTNIFFEREAYITNINNLKDKYDFYISKSMLLEKG